MGGFGLVFLGCLGTLPVAIKRNRFDRPSKFIEEELQQIHKIGSHPNIVSCLGYFRDHSGLNIVLEFMPETLNDIINKKSWANIVLFFTQTVDALAFIHSKSIIHRDVKPLNILVSETTAKLADFGTSKVIFKQQYENEHTTVRSGYTKMAPETKKGNYSPASDFFGIGVIMNQIISGGHIGYQTPQLAKLAAELMYKDPNSRPNAQAILVCLRSMNGKLR